MVVGALISDIETAQNGLTRINRNITADSIDFIGVKSSESGTTGEENTKELPSMYSSKPNTKQKVETAAQQIEANNNVFEDDDIPF